MTGSIGIVGKDLVFLRHVEALEAVLSLFPVQTIFLIKPAMNEIRG
uniref:Uncharacterized protein n=1 Tax=Brassica oleracea TaxID=3712 RepID=A0A3P6GWX1_BRAOL|nr:unnamed protein product [Brassica oleracea]